MAVKKAALCPKGNAGVMQLYDPDREKAIKTYKPGTITGADPRQEKITWRAMGEISGS